MDIQRAKEEIKQTVRAYLACDDTGAPLIPPVRQRPILLMGPPGVGKTQIMEQIAQECGIALVARPEVWHDRAVPPILLSGHHANVEKWRRKQGILRTYRRRPDLYGRLDLSSKQDRRLLKELEEETGEKLT